MGNPPTDGKDVPTDVGDNPTDKRTRFICGEKSYTLALAEESAVFYGTSPHAL